MLIHLVSCCTLIFGRLYQFYPTKTVFLTVMTLFEIGSAICGAAPNSNVLIAGRAIAGLGAAGLQSGSVLIFFRIIPLHKQPLWQGFMAAIFGVASVLGPLLGGVFTENISWRWCFYINLPIGAITLVVVFFLFNMPFVRHGPPLNLKQQFLALDPIGNIIFMPGIVCLLLALQWGGGTYAWSSPAIIALLVAGPVLILAFIASQLLRSEKAVMVPPRIVRQRTVASSLLFSFCIGGLIVLTVFYLPLWFQAIKGASPQKSGFMNLPMIIAMVVASIVGGGAIKAIGYYAPFMVATSVITAIGAGLFTTFTTSTGHDKWIGYQFIFGFGLGVGMMQSSTAIRACLGKADLAVGMACAFFLQTLGSALFVALGQAVFQSVLTTKLNGVSGLDVSSIINTGATQLRTMVDADLLPSVLDGYNTAITRVFFISMALGLLSLVGSLCVEWKSIKLEKGAGEGGKEVPKGKEGV